MSTLRTALTIAGSDSGGGAGIQADLKTFSAFGVFGMSAITAITAQNTLGVSAIQAVDKHVVVQQITDVVSDIGVDAAKTGMLADEELTLMVAEQIKKHKIKRLVVDTVMISKSGHTLLTESAIQVMKSELIPLAELITPNLLEAEKLTGLTIQNTSDMKNAARALMNMGPRNVLVKGGHLEDDICTDILFDGKNFTEFSSMRFNTRNTHGTGCTYSAAITAGLAKGKDLTQSVALAKKYISRAIETSLPLGKGHGPTNHFTDITSPWNV